MDRASRYSYFLIPTILIFVLLNLFPRGIDTIYQENYVFNSLFLCIIMTLLCIHYVKKGFDLFEPINIVSAIYVCMYFITPLHDILSGTILWYGYDLFGYGIKASWYAFIGYIAFYFFYTSNIRVKLKSQIKNDKAFSIKNNKESPGIVNSNVIVLILIMYFVCFLANIYYVTHHFGNSWLYVLSLGILGSSNSVQKAGSIEFIGILSYSLPTVTMLYWEYGKSKSLKIFLFVPMFMLQVARGFRFLIFAIAFSFLSYYYLKKNTRPKIVNIIVFAIILLVPVFIMTMFRNTIRSGSGIELSAINADSLETAFDDTFWYNFRIYKNYYGMVGVIPEKFGYVYFRQIVVGTAVMLIPRIIWPGKISSWGGETLEVLIGPHFARTGQAYPSLGEYYYALGIVGIIIMMGIHGAVLNRVQRKYSKSNDGLDIILYSMLLGCNLQYMIRGYMASNFWYIVFSLIPIWIMKFITKPKEDN